MHGFAKTLTAALLSAGLTSNPVSADTQPLFVFDGQGVTNPDIASEFVKLGEKLPIARLKQRFSRYGVASTAGEDCTYCAVVGNALFEIDYDQRGITVTSVITTNPKAVDVLGNAVGDSLRNAVGNKAICDAGLFLSCRTTKIDNFDYIVKDDGANCLNTKDADGKTEIDIPTCAKIGGFSIAERSDSFTDTPAENNIYNCQNSAVKDTVYSIIRKNIFEVLGNAQTAEAKSYMLAYTLSAVGQIDPRKRDMVDAFKEFQTDVPANTVFSMDQLFQESADEAQKSYVCRAKISMMVPWPASMLNNPSDPGSKALRDRFPDGSIKESVALRYEVHPELSGNGKFNVEISLH